MAAARVCRSTLNPAGSFQCAIRSRSRATLPYLRACSRSFNNTTPIIEADNLPPDPPVQTPQPNLSNNTSSSVKTTHNDHVSPLSHALASQQTSPPQSSRPRHPHSTVQSARYDPNRAPTAPVNSPTSPLQLTDALRQSLPYLTSQPPFYVTIHIHGKPYLVTEGDTIRLPFLMHGVMPGDILRLDRASLLGSREWTLRAGSPISPASTTGGSRSESHEGLAATAAIIGKTADLPPSPTNPHQIDSPTSQIREQRPKRNNKPTYLDPRLFVCRATVLGTESEPLRIMEKTKQRSRRIKHVKSRMRFTTLRIREISVKGVEELDKESVDEQRFQKLKSDIFAR